MQDKSIILIKNYLTILKKIFASIKENNLILKITLYKKIIPLLIIKIRVLYINANPSN